MTDTENIKMEIQEITDGLSDQVSLPVYYKYRYTFDKDTELEQQKKLARDILKVIQNRYACDTRYTLGIEHFTKGKLSTKPHLHIHFISKKTSNTIRKGLAQEFNFIGRCQCCKAEAIVNEEKFFNYPLKQQKNDTARFVLSSFPKEETLKMIDVAYSIWMVSSEVAVNKLEKKIERNSEDRVFHVLDNYFNSVQPTDTLSYYDVLNVALNYYAHNEPTFNYSTIVGYVDKYLIKNGKLSIQKYLKMKNVVDFDLA